MDSPEVLDAWIAERKKRFPTSSRIEDKKRKMEDAIARGQLNITSATIHSNKRQKYGHRFDNHGFHSKIQSRTGKKNDVRTTDAGWGGRVRVVPTSPLRAITTNEASHSSSSAEDTNCEPEVLSSKIQHASEIPVVQEDLETKALAPSPSVVKNNTVVPHRSSALQPKNPPRNPFASRPTLLRNVSHSALF